MLCSFVLFLWNPTPMLEISCKTFSLLTLLCGIFKEVLQPILFEMYLFILQGLRSETDIHIYT